MHVRQKDVNIEIGRVHETTTTTRTVCEASSLRLFDGSFNRRIRLFAEATFQSGSDKFFFLEEVAATLGSVHVNTAESCSQPSIFIGIDL